MGTWNSTYETLPQNVNNPGRGAEAVRELKTEIRSRLEVEQFFGPNEDAEASRFGLNKEGSARVLVKDPYSVSGDRDPVVNDQLNAGRVEVNLEDREVGDVKLYDGDTEATAPAGKFAPIDSKYRRLRVLAYDDLSGSIVGWKTLYDVDEVVDLKFDQNIDGRKNFTLPPIVKDQTVPSGRGESWFHTDFATGATENQKKIATNMDNVRNHLVEVLTSNTLDPADHIVTNFLLALNPLYVVNGYVDKTVKVTTIEAENIIGDRVEGAVWI